jgi:hypothetical protein
MDQFPISIATNKIIYGPDGFNYNINNTEVVKVNLLNTYLLSQY